MSDLIRHVDASVKAKRLFRDGQGILVALSGGLDSMVLLALLHRLAKSHRWKLTVAHFNHRLRGTDSDGDERLTRKTAEKLKLAFVAGRGDVREFARSHGLSLEMAARKLRHVFLAETATKLKIPTIAVAHHADDQVELFFVRLLRGAGGEGLAGMKWRNASPSAAKIRLARPLLDVSKAALRAFASENRIAFSEDTSNDSLDIQRNRIRHELIPLLAQHYQPALTGNVLRLMDVVGTESELVAQIASEWLKAKRRPEFDALPVAVQRRVVQQQLVKLKIAPEFDLIERLRTKVGLWMTVSAGTCVLRDKEGLICFRPTESVQFSGESRQVLLSARRRKVAFGGVKICWQIADDNGMIGVGDNLEYFDAGKVGTRICLRHWQPGDKFQPIGTGSARKLQDLFTNLKVPRGERRQRVVATTHNGELFWVEGLRMAEKFKLDEKTTRRLKWNWRRDGALNSKGCASSP